MIAAPAGPFTSLEAAMRAKSFFLVCAGLFLLALTYHLGARNATAQSGAVVGSISWQASQFAIVLDRVPYRATNGLPSARAVCNASSPPKVWLVLMTPRLCNNRP